MTIVKKTYEPQYVHIKAQGDQGIVNAVVSVWDVVDLQGDRVRRGAFTRSLARWKASGDFIPFVHAHDWLNPMAHVGFVTDARETSEGLEITAQLDIKENPVAAQIFKLLKERRIREYSFAYDILRERRADDGAIDLLELDIIECGSCLKGANPLTRTITAKTAVDPTHGADTWHATPAVANLVIDHAEANFRRKARLMDEPAYWNQRLDALEAPHRKTGQPDMVDQFLREERERRAAEAQARAQQAAWEERQLTMVRDPVPVRVDARMRPDR